MENFRWILIIAGVAILALLYFSGRPKRSTDQREALDRSRNRSRRPGVAAHGSADNYDDLADDGVYADSQAGYRHATHGAADPLMAGSTDGHFDDLPEMDPDDFVRPGSGELQYEDAGELETTATRSSIAQKIESFSSRLSPRRGQRVAAVAEQEVQQANVAPHPSQSKIVTLHVVAPLDQVFNGADLYEVFEQRGFHFGDMNIFHSMHQQKKMFSIAKMVEPGYFDINDIESFYTPGITLILQLPGPVAADVAFEVLISEARELAQHLGGVVLGGDRSTLSNQAVQHMREDIYEFMHRQRYFANAAT